MYQAMSVSIALYGQGVAQLKKHTELMLDMAERLELPEEAVAGAAKVTVTAGRKALIENHRGIVEYGPERIVIGTERGKLSLSGSALRIMVMDRNVLLIGGDLQYAEWS